VEGGRLYPKGWAERGQGKEGTEVDEKAQLRSLIPLQFRKSLTDTGEQFEGLCQVLRRGSRMGKERRLRENINARGSVPAPRKKGGGEGLIRKKSFGQKSDFKRK